MLVLVRYRPEDLLLDDPFVCVPMHLHILGTENRVGHHISIPVQQPAFFWH